MSLKVDSRLHRAYNRLVTIASKEHTDREWKSALIQMLEAIAVEIEAKMTPQYIIGPMGEKGDRGDTGMAGRDGVCVHHEPRTMTIDDLLPVKDKYQVTAR